MGLVYSSMSSFFASVFGIRSGMCVINGRTFAGRSIVVNESGTFVDGKEVDVGDGKKISIVVNGPVDGNIDATGRVEVNGNVTGKVSAGMDLKCGDVNGNAGAGMSCYCGTVTGDVRAGMGVEAKGHIGGKVSAGMGVECCKK